MSYETAIQQAIYSRLTATPALVSAVVGIYDEVPQVGQGAAGGDFPYVVIGEDTFEPWDTDTGVGADATVTIHVWSRQRGRAETKQIQGLIYDALHRAEIAITGLQLVGIEWEYSESLLDPDGVTRHGVQRFRFTVEK